MMVTRAIRHWLAAGLVVLAGGVAQAQPVPLTVFAAASLTDVAQAVGDQFNQDTGVDVRFSFGSSSTMARQVIAGAPADVFMSANKDWADQVTAEAEFSAPQAVFTNRLVIIAPKGSGEAVTLDQLPGLLGDQRLAVGDPTSVPAGIYAEQAMKSAGIWDDLESRLAPAEDVRAALRLVEQGAAPFGIVYATDVAAGDVEVVGEIDQSLYPPVTYYMSFSPEASDAAVVFAGYFSSGPAKAILTQYGFAPLEADQ